MGFVIMDNAPECVRNKIFKFSEGYAPLSLDLFAGCGGLSLGFHSEGFQMAGAVEIEPEPAISHATNFFRDLPEEEQKAHAIPRDITITEPSRLLRELGFSGPADSYVDAIIGGPPCQAFARVGRAKLREVAEHPEAFLQDPRSNLYLRYLRYVKELCPLALLMENVPDVLNYGGHNIAEEMCEVLEDLGYVPKYTLLNAVYYGVPQMRERMFLVAFRKELPVQKWFPTPTHWIRLPQGYHGSRQVALKSVNGSLFSRKSHYEKPPDAVPSDCLPAVTAEQALSDLPPITLHLEGKLKRGPRYFNEPVYYPTGKKLSTYQNLMRTWPGFEAGESIYDHVIRYLPRDYPIFRLMNPGDQYPEAHRHAEKRFEGILREREQASGKKIQRGSDEFKKARKAVVPPYDPGKFPNKWRKMEADLPARTLMAHLGKDSYSHIHYDSSQARTISVREAARLQSFPDGFVFQGPMNPAFRQIGNAVPPLLAKAIAQTMFDEMKKAVEYATQNCAETTDSI